MKKSLLLSLFGLALVSTAATARERMVDGIPDEDIVQVVDMVGRPGYQTKAALVKSHLVDPAGALELVIIESKNGANYLVVSNPNLNLSLSDKFASTNASLNVNGAGSLQVSSNNETFPSRDQWRSTLTISFRNNQYVLSGITIMTVDKLVEKSLIQCDFNLLTGKGVLNGKPVVTRGKPVNVNKLNDTEALTNCKMWL